MDFKWSKKYLQKQNFYQQLEYFRKPASLFFKWFNKSNQLQDVRDKFVGVHRLEIELANRRLFKKIFKNYYPNKKVPRILGLSISMLIWLIS